MEEEKILSLEEVIELINDRVLDYMVIYSNENDLFYYASWQ